MRSQLPRPPCRASIPAVLIALCATVGAAPQAHGADRVDLRNLEPYLLRGTAATARVALLAGQPERAVAGLRRYLRRKQVRHRSQAQFLLALALLESKQYEQAARQFGDLVASYPLLRDYHHFYRARALYRLRNFSGALDSAGAVDASAALHTDAQLLQADALHALQRLDEAAAIWKQYLKRHPRGGRVGEAHFRIAEALAAKAGQEAERLAAAIEHYKQVTIQAPLWKSAEEAGRRAKQLAAKHPTGAKLLVPSIAERMRQAQVWYRAMRNDRAEAAFAAILSAGKELDERQRCRASYYRAKSVFKARQRDRAAPLFDDAAARCRKAGIESLVIKSLYNRGRGLTRMGQHEAAARQFLDLERQFASHSYADDARLRAAEAYTELDQQEEVTKLLSTIPTRYPQGDMAREALWRLAFRAYRQGQLSQAQGYLDRILRELGRATHYYAEGQALYWKGRILDRSGRRKAAADSYARCVRDYPLSYYALMAFNRLRERHSARFRQLWRELIVPIGRRLPPVELSVGALARNPSFRRGTELARLGLGQQAARELVGAGLSISSKAPKDRLWLAAVLYDRAGIWYLSHQVPRSRDTTYKRSYPHARNYQPWRIAYPDAYAPHVRREARRNAIPAQLVLAIMREESGFLPTIESYANAIGLMQLILPTARAAGARFKLEVNRAVLHDPATNIKLGSSFLGWLFKTFGRSHALAIAGYNAGYGAVFRWLRQFGSVQLDEFIERIPYDQTRRYTKRVLASLFAYSMLHGPRRLPRIGLQIPRPTHRSFGAPKRNKQ